MIRWIRQTKTNIVELMKTYHISGNQTKGQKRVISDQGGTSNPATIGRSSPAKRKAITMNESRQTANAFVRGANLDTSMMYMGSIMSFLVRAQDTWTATLRAWPSARPAWTSRPMPSPISLTTRHMRSRRARNTV